MSTANQHSRVWRVLFCLAGSVLLLSSCSSDEVDAILGDQFVNISGQVTSTGKPLGEEGVTVTGIYSNGSPLNPSTTTGSDGGFTLPVLKNTAVSVQVSKAGFVTLNSAIETLNLDISGFDVEVPTTMEVDSAIFNAFAAAIAIPGQAWLAVNVVDSLTDEDVAGITISVTGAAGTFVYTDCDGIGTPSPVTVVDVNPCNRGGPMYFAYFDTDSAEVTVSDGVTQQLAPVRRGEVTFLEFEQ